MSVQRSISFLPVRIDPAVRGDAASTWDWRWEMWRATVPVVPQYLLLGKGFNFDGTDYYLTMTGYGRGMSSVYDAAMISSDYHQGILTLIIPFGIWGLLAFIAFCLGSLRALYRNYRYGPEQLRSINTFLLSYFIARLTFYLFFYGEFYLDLMLFTGTVGLSLSLNGGVRQETKLAIATTKVSTAALDFQPI